MSVPLGGTQNRVDLRLLVEEQIAKNTILRTNLFYFEDFLGFEEIVFAFGFFLGKLA